MGSFPDDAHKPGIDARNAGTRAKPNGTGTNKCTGSDTAPAMIGRDLTSLPTGMLGRQVFILALPMLGEQFLNFMVSMVDTSLAGTISKEATAAVGTASYVGWFITLAFQLVGVGASALVARMYGARDIGTANRGLNQAMVMALLIGAAVTVVVLFAATPFSSVLLRTTEASTMCSTYLRIDAWSYTAASLSFVGLAIVRAAGDTRSPMWIMVAVNVLNIVISMWLLFGLGWGVVGIAIGTVVARGAGGVLTLVVLWRGLRGLRLEWRLLRPDFPIIGRIVRVGLPSAGEASIMFLTQLIFIFIVTMTATGADSTVNYAAHLIAIRAEGITYLPAIAWMTAAATLVGQYLGANQPERAARAAHLAALQAGLLTTAAGIAFFVFAEPFYAFMSNDPQVRAVGVPAFRIMAFFQPLLGMGIVYVGSLRGAGDTRAALIVTTITALLVRVPLAYLFGVVLHGGLIGAWIGMWCDNVLRCLLMAGRFVQGGWKKIEV